MVGISATVRSLPLPALFAGSLPGGAGRLLSEAWQAQATESAVDDQDAQQDQAKPGVIGPGQALAQDYDAQQDADHWHQVGDHGDVAGRGAFEQAVVDDEGQGGAENSQGDDGANRLS